MDYFNYREDELYAEDVAVKDIVAAVGSPCYIYSRATLERHWKAFDDSLKGHEHLVCYAVKANSNLAVLNLFARLGSGFDIVSAGELLRVIKAGGDPSKIVFSGVAKKRDEIKLAIEKGIHCFNVESEAELSIIDEVALSLNVKAPIALRVNPDVDAGTHPYISTGLKENKFGIDIDVSLPLYQRAAKMKNIKIKGIACHIGSQLTEVTPFLDALDRVVALVDQLSAIGIELEHLDLGGGLGICYKDELPPAPAEYAKAIIERLGENRMPIHIEPGRAIAGNAGVLVTTVEYLKHTEHKNFALVDAAMNDLIRPSLYSAWQEIIPVSHASGKASGDIESQSYDVVGPVCETGDFLGKDRQLTIAAGDLLAVRSSGAYGFTMSSNYNSRPRVAEVMVDGDQFHIVRKREVFDDLIRGESILGDN
ncbi:MAG: diaminopimelate decarboxylase [Gammaproteobacteria bacterium]|nr:diaminopimelate decarboxylase [Gammaproteobacteria bacterium]